MLVITLYYFSVREHFAIMLASPVAIFKLDRSSRQNGEHYTFQNRCALVTANTNSFAKVDTASDHSLGRQHACRLANHAFLLAI